MTRSLARSISANWIGTVVNVLLTLLVTPIIVRSVGSENYGVLVLLTSLAGHIAVMDFGFRYALVKYVAEYRAKQQWNELTLLLSSALSILCIPAVFILSLSFFGWEVFQDVFAISAQRENKIFILLMLFTLDGTLELCCGVFSSALGGCERYDVLNLANSSRLLLYAIAVVGTLYFGGGILSVALVYVTTRILHRLVLVLALVRNLPNCRLRIAVFHRPSIKTLLRYSSWAFVIVITERIINQSQPWIIGSFLNKDTIAIYALGAMLIEQVRFLGLQASTILSTRLASCVALDNSSSASALLERWFLYAPLLAGLFAIPFMVSGTDFIALWVGSAFVSNSGFLAIMACALVFVLPAFGFSAMLFATNQHRLVALVQLIEGPLNVGISAWLVHSYQLRGVACGYVVSAVVCSGLLLPMLAAPRCGVSHKRYISLLFCSVLPTFLPYIAILLALRSLLGVDSWISFILVHLIAALLYSIVAFLLVLKPEDRAYLGRRFGFSA